MRILVLADVHGEYPLLNHILSYEKNFDLIVNPGDTTDMFTTPQEFSQVDIGDIVIQKLLSVRKPVLCVPGNHDPFELVEVFEEYGVNVHNTTRFVGGVQFVGFGGAFTPFRTLYEPSDEEICESLGKLAPKLRQPFVLVVHNPPKNTTNDKILSGQHVGSEAVRAFIEQHQPLLCICSHIYEGRGTDKIGKTVTFYPGAVVEGRYGIVEINGNIVECTSKLIPKTTRAGKSKPSARATV